MNTQTYLLIDTEDAHRFDGLSVTAFELLRVYGEIISRGGKGRSVENFRLMKEVIDMMRDRLNLIEQQADKLLENFGYES